MIQDTIVKINALIEQADRLTSEQRHQLLDLIAQLQRDIQLIETVDHEQAQSSASHENNWNIASCG